MIKGSGQNSKLLIEPICTQVVVFSFTTDPWNLKHACIHVCNYISEWKVYSIWNDVTNKFITKFYILNWFSSPTPMHAPKVNALIKCRQENVPGASLLAGYLWMWSTCNQCTCTAYLHLRVQLCKFGNYHQSMQILGCTKNCVFSKLVTFWFRLK